MPPPRRGGIAAVPPGPLGGTSLVSPERSDVLVDVALVDVVLVGMAPVDLVPLLVRLGFA